MSTILYKIKDWDKHYEVSDSKKVAGPLQWVAVRTKTDGFGYLRITQQKNRSELLSAWYLMLGIAAKQPREERGKLARDGVPLTPEDMELLTRFPAQLFANALVFFSDPRQGWLDSDESGLNPDASGRNRAPSESSGSTVHTIHTGQDRGCGGRAPSRAAAAAPATDSEWMASLKANPAYRGIDVDREYGKMLAWCQTNNRQPNRKRFVNWLNKCDRPLANAPIPRVTEPEVEPDGWRAYWRETYPPEEYPNATRYDDGAWWDIPAPTRKEIISGMRKRR